MRVWVPYAQVIPRLALPADVYDGGSAPPAGREEVEFFVLPYEWAASPVELFATMPRLRVIQALTKGYEHLVAHVPAGVTLCNAGGLHDASTAELAVTLMLASLRGVPSFVRAQDRAQWAHERLDALADKHVLIIGHGGIGAAVERRLAGFEVEIRRVARHAREGVSPMAELPGLLPWADVVVLAIPLTEETRGLVDAAFLARMPDGALLVNVARGAIVDTGALLAELATGRLRAAVDVTDPEPPPPGHPLWSAPGLLISPHVGGDSSAFLPRALRLIEDQVGRYARDEPMLYQVR